MARIRSIKPEFWTNERVMECSLNARLLFIGMWNFADDLGRLPLSAKSIKAMVFPSDELSAESILGMIDELSKNGLVLIYRVEDRDYLQITGWQHQRIDKPQPGKCPSPVNGYSENVRGTVAMDTKGEEGKGEDRNSEAKASGADAPVDHRTRLFNEGLAKLSSLTGKGPDACRSFVGKCLKAAGDDAVTVLGLIEDAERNRAVDPSAWIAARLKSTGPPSKPQTAHQQERQTGREILDDIGKFISGSSSEADPGLLRHDPGDGPESIRGRAGGDLVELSASGSRKGH